jgi:replication-associated recombination protein RarA
MLTGGEDPLYIARRLVVMSSEDVGLADPHALPLVRIVQGASVETDLKATATYQACQTIGMPECRINLAVSLPVRCKRITAYLFSIASPTWLKRPNRLVPIMPTNEQV